MPANRFMLAFAASFLAVVMGVVALGSLLQWWKGDVYTLIILGLFAVMVGQVAADVSN